MKMISRKFLVLSVGTSLLLAGGTADAAFKVRVALGATSITITDGDGNDLDGAAGSIIANVGGTFGFLAANNLQVAASTAISPKGPISILQSTASFQFGGGGTAGTYIIDATATDRLSNGSDASVSFTPFVIAPPGGARTSKTWFSSSNAEFDMTGSSFPVLSGAGGSTSGLLSPPVSSPFSITTRMTHTYASGNLAILNTTATIGTPEPGVFLLTGLGLPLAAYFGLRRKKKAVNGGADEPALG